MCIRDRHYTDPLSLELLSSKFFVSKYHLSHEFNRVVGTSVYRYIVQKRLVIAKQMLAGGVAPTDVYRHCGFGDYANFYRAFKAEYHISPKQYPGLSLIHIYPQRQHQNQIDRIKTGLHHRSHNISPSLQNPIFCTKRMPKASPAPKSAAPNPV